MAVEDKYRDQGKQNHEERTPGRTCSPSSGERRLIIAHNGPNQSDQVQ